MEVVGSDLSNQTTMNDYLPNSMAKQRRRRKNCCSGHGKHHQTGEATFHLREAVVDQCKSLIVTQARRTHESQDRIGLTAGFEDLYWDLAYERAEEKGFPLGPREELASHPRIQALISNAKQNERANFASGDHPILKDKETRFLRNAGLVVGVLPCSGPRLVVGNQGITILVID